MNYYTLVSETAYCFHYAATCAAIDFSLAASRVCTYVSEMRHFMASHLTFVNYESDIHPFNFFEYKTDIAKLMERAYIDDEVLYDITKQIIDNKRYSYEENVFIKALNSNLFTLCNIISENLHNFNEQDFSKYHDFVCVICGNITEEGEDECSVCSSKNQSIPLFRL